MTVIKRAPKQATADPISDQTAIKAAATAPDSKAKRNMRGKREMFSVGLEPDFLAEVDTVRSKLGLSRPALIKLALRRLIDSGV